MHRVFSCQNTCHVVRDHEENKPAFAGPRFFIRYAELDMHPLDTVDRKNILQEEQGLGLCNITKCCTEVCPEHIKITDNAIIPMKERVVDVKFDPWGKVMRTRREAEQPRTPASGRSSSAGGRTAKTAAAAQTVLRTPPRPPAAPASVGPAATTAAPHLPSPPVANPPRTHPLPTRPPSARVVLTRATGVASRPTPTGPSHRAPHTRRRARHCTALRSCCLPERNGGRIARSSWSSLTTGLQPGHFRVRRGCSPSMPRILSSVTAR